MDRGAKSDVKQYRTCKLCRNQQKETAKKRWKKMRLDDGIDCLEVIEANDLPEYLVQLLNSYRTQIDRNSVLNARCIYPYIIKQQRKSQIDFVESIEDIDEFSWMYVFCIVHCSQID